MKSNFGGSPTVRIHLFAFSYFPIGTSARGIFGTRAKISFSCSENFSGFFFKISDILFYLRSLIFVYRCVFTILLGDPISAANSLRLDCSCCNFKTASRLCVSTSIILSEIGAIFRFFRASRSASGNSLIHFISNIVYTNTISCTREYIINLYIIPIMDSFLENFVIQ